MHNRKEADEKNAHRLCVRRGAATAWEGPRTPRMNAARARNPPARCQNPSQMVRGRLTLSDTPGQQDPGILGALSPIKLSQTDMLYRAVRKVEHVEKTCSVSPGVA